MTEQKLTITKIKALNKVGIFRAYTPAADMPPFRQLNLIYGFNGSGKTTLSRVFSSLQTGALHGELPPDSAFEFELSDGTSIKSSDSLDRVKDRLLVFNVDFVDSSIQWKEGQAKGVYYIGSEQAELAKELDKKRAAFSQLNATTTVLEKGRDRAQRDFSEFKKDTAKTISLAANLGRLYNATHLESDYAKKSYNADLILANEDLELPILQSQILEKEPLPKISCVNKFPSNLLEIIDEAGTLLKKTLGHIALEEIEKHGEMLHWIKEGLDYHERHDLSSCLFCGNKIQAARLVTLKSSIDDRYDQFKSDVQKSSALLEGSQEALSGLLADIPSSELLVVDECRAEYSRLYSELRALVKDISLALSSLTAEVKKKIRDINVSIDLSSILDRSQIVLTAKAAEECREKVEKLLELHNSVFDKFNNRKTLAHQKIREHFLAQSQSRFSTLKAAVKDTEDMLDRHLLVVRNADEEIRVLALKVQQHGPAAEAINDLLHAYLGRKDITISTTDDGFRIDRNNIQIRGGSLSEGEKTALSLCYFISKIKEQGKVLSDLIVVVDDPISSLDTKALNYAFSLLSGALSGAAQLIMLTHNLQFMLAAKKWMIGKTEHGADYRKLEKTNKPKIATASLFFLDVTQRDVENREARIIEMPHLLREYDSEYHYLFWLLWSFCEAAVNSPYFLVMPNVMRKILELFLAFKMPGSGGLGQKISQIPSDLGLDVSRMRALERLVQLESHGDNLNDFLEHSSLTIEETKESASALMLLIRRYDEGHYNQMIRLASRG
ncbi:AAA family ATPase [Ferrovibrio sp.]|uniref:AAA family ATPase n=1 Tax=Ferrovibrio sp. TaxID=1917215 RepID=UPI0035B2C9E6